MHRHSFWGLAAVVFAGLSAGTAMALPPITALLPFSQLSPTSHALSNDGELVFTASDGTTAVMFSKTRGGELITIFGSGFSARDSSIARTGLSGFAGTIVGDISGAAVTRSTSGGIALTIRGADFGPDRTLVQSSIQDDGSLLAVVARHDTVKNSIGNIRRTPAGTVEFVEIGQAPIAPVDEIASDSAGTVAYRASGLNPDGSPRDITDAPIYVGRTGGILLTVRGDAFGMRSLSTPDVDGDELVFAGQDTGSSDIIIAILTKKGYDAYQALASESKRVVAPGTNQVAINDLTAFFAARRPDGTTPFIGYTDFWDPNGAVLPLIRVGDPLDGSTVESLRFDKDGLNDNGALAFYAQLSDGRSGFYLANVPEPSLLGVPAMLAALLLRRR
jgi:hypothetical protein